MRPLEGLFVLDLAQYLAGPSATLRLADLGARVVKLERPGSGDACRRLRLADLVLPHEADSDSAGRADSAASADRSDRSDSLLFHTINRGKESVAVDLADPADRSRLLQLVPHADVLVHSFRPGALDRFGLDYAAVAELNPRLVYAHVSGYGEEGPWRSLPGQDLLVQARSGLAWLNGTAADPPEPLGLSVVDHLAGAYLVEGVLACLVRRGVTGRGGLVQVSLLEAAMDLQFEVFTGYLNGGGTPIRSEVSAAHPFVGGQYGIYQTSDAWIALAMGSLSLLGELLGVPDLAATPEAPHGLDRDAVKRALAGVLRTRTTSDWLAILVPAGYWCAEVRDWPALEESGVLDALRMVVEHRTDERAFRGTRCPVRIDGQVLAAPGVAPRLGEHAELPGGQAD
ncbi:MAG: CaiB/BaiF CoA transferase family protein [Actinopolymorphaceae bacterium]